MLTLIAAIGIGVLLFTCLYLGFRTGLRLGMQASKGREPTKLDPVGAVTQAVTGTKQKGAQAQMMRGYAAMMEYTGEPKKGA